MASPFACSNNSTACRANDGCRVGSVRTLIRFGYAHVQMMLYRPFLHYISPRLTAGKQIDNRYYNCAAAGITVSRNIVHIGIEIQKQAALIGPYWFILYTEFFAILSLLFFVLENPDKPGSAEILADARAGREVIATLTKRSLAADRITAALNVSLCYPRILAREYCADSNKPLFDQLPERLKKPNARPTPTKKRSAPAPNSAQQGSRAGSVTLPSRPDVQDGVPQRRSEEMARPAIGLLRRDARAPPQRTASFDTIGFQHGSLAGQNFTSFQDILPMNMPLSGPGSDSGGTPGAMNRHTQGFQQGQHAGGPVGSLYKMDAMMFPSEDPFAYPHQPPIDAANQHPASQTPQSSAGQPHDTMQFYIPNMYDGIEGQILDPIPGYLMPQEQRQTTHGLDTTAQLYNTSTMLDMQSGHGGHAHQQPHHHQQIAVQQQMNQSQQQQQRHQQQQQQQSGSMMDEMLTDPSFQGEWDDMMGNPGYR